MADWLLYEHEDGRYAVAPSAEAATFAHGNPAWHRVGPVEVPVAGLRAAEIVQAEIDRAEALLNVEDGGAPVFDRAQTEAGICALRVVLEAIRAADVSGVPEADDSGPLREGWQISIGPGHAGFGCYAHMTEYPDEGAVCLATFDPKEYPDAAVGVVTVEAPSKCEFPLCAVHHICDRNCERNAGVDSVDGGKHG